MPLPSIQQRSIPTGPFRLPVMQPCQFCEAKQFPYETPKFCCSSGEVSLYPIAIPLQLQQLYFGSRADSNHFLQYIKPYNDIFSFTSIGVHLDPLYAKRVNEIYTFRAQGIIYHAINGLYSSGQIPSYLQLYFYDTRNEVNNRKTDHNKLCSDIILQLINILKINPYSKFFRGLNEIPNIEEYQIRLKANLEMHERTAQPPTVSQVAAIWIEDEDAIELQERDIVVQKHDGHSKHISYYYGCYDSLQYMLLFPLGEPRWHQGIKKIKTNIGRQICSSHSKISPAHSLRQTIYLLMKQQVTIS